MGDIGDLAGDFFDDLTTWMDDAFDWVSDFVSDIYDWVEDLVQDVWEFTEENWELVTVAVVLIITGVYLVDLNMIMTTIQTAGQYIANVSGWIEDFQVLYAAFSSAIHLDTLIKVHALAMIVSSDYRAVWNQIYGRLAKISAALGFSAEFVTLALRNARAIVLDVTSFMGYSYDMAELTWFNLFVDYMDEFGKKAESYSKDPEAFLNDVDQWLVKGAIDTKSAFQLTLLTSLENVVDMTTDTVGKVVTIRDDLGKLVSDLPEFIKDEVGPALDGILDPFDDWISETYTPVVDKLEGVVSVLSQDMIDTKVLADQVVDRLLHPGTLLEHVDLLEGAEKETEEGKIAEVATRQTRTEIDTMNEDKAELETRLKDKIDSFHVRALKPFWNVPERTNVGKSEAEIINTGRTWFSGDH